MRFSVETWAPEYGGGPDPAEMVPATGRVDATVERELADWAPIEPRRDGPEPEAIRFVDGVRRIDARVWIGDRNGSRPGVCATVAAGVVECRAGRAAMTGCRVRHLLVAEADGAGPIVTRHATYELHPVPEATAEGLYLGIHDQMTALEATVSGDAVDFEPDPGRPDDGDHGHDGDHGNVGGAVVVFDGPLRGRHDPAAVGVVKSHHVQYLPEEVQPVIGALDAGQRTPLLLLRQGPATRWTWYLRLPGPVPHAWAGVVRCELPAVGTAEQAAARADLVSAILPTYASEPHKDPRAPQNLYPIAGLERELRRRLGDAVLLERSLRSAAAEMAS